MSRLQWFLNNYKKNFIIALSIFLIVSTLLILSMLIEKMSFIWNYLDYILILRKISQYVLIALGLYLLFRPWIKWVNNYWEDTKNVKIWLMG